MWNRARLAEAKPFLVRPATPVRPLDDDVRRLDRRNREHSRNEPELVHGFGTDQCDEAVIAAHEVNLSHHLVLFHRGHESDEAVPRR